MPKSELGPNKASVSSRSTIQASRMPVKPFCKSTSTFGSV
ncbi:hypothetical protein BMETH_3171_0 [methanotrophic bacterial endosymbiont of Bathymodiolus sp.]|nr:hypothetical protein BMETH_3171_0 [methanotrophic bacterial endosymbiont of Bathymodiolus sp.]